MYLPTDSFERALQLATAEYNAFPKGNPKHRGYRAVAAKYAESGINFSNLYRSVNDGIKGKRKFKPCRGGDGSRDQVAYRLKDLYDRYGKIPKVQSRAIVLSEFKRATGKNWADAWSTAEPAKNWYDASPSLADHTGWI